MAEKNNIRKTNDGNGSKYDEFLNRNSWQFGRPLQEFIAKRIISITLKLTNLDLNSITLIEFGSGHGHLGKAADQIGIRNYIGIEPNSALAAYSRSKLNNANILEYALPFIGDELTGTADLAISTHVIEHAKDGYEARTWIEAMKRCLKKDGFLAIYCPDIKDYGNSFWDIDWSHAFPTTLNNVTQICLDLGLQPISSLRIRGATTNPLVRLFAYGICFLIPTRAIDYLSRKLVGRDLATGLKVALFYGNVYVVAKNTTKIR